MVSKTLVRINNFSLRLRSIRCRAGEILVLIPSCLQNSKCTAKVTVDVANCKRCGSCPVGTLAQLCDGYGVRIACAAGGRLALDMVRDNAVKAVVAVACEKELRAGIIGAFPKPVSAVCNVRPHGPCRDTGVDVDNVRRAIDGFLAASPAENDSPGKPDGVSSR